MTRILIPCSARTISGYRCTRWAAFWALRPGRRSRAVCAQHRINVTGPDVTFVEVTR